MFTHELVSPVPKRRCPELLQTLHHASSQGPNLRCRTSFFAEVATKKEESGGRCDGVRPRRAVADTRVDVGGEIGDGRQADKEESDGEEDPGN